MSVVTVIVDIYCTREVTYVQT